MKESVPSQRPRRNRRYSQWKGLGLGLSFSGLLHLAGSPAQTSVIKGLQDGIGWVKDSSRRLIKGVLDDSEEPPVRIKNPANPQENPSLPFSKSLPPRSIIEKNSSPAENPEVNNEEKQRPVIQVQLPEEEATVQQIIDERLARIDLKALEVYKVDVINRWRKGEFVPADELYPTLERLNGVPKEQVEVFSEKLGTRVQALTPSMGNDFTDDFIHTIVDKRFEESIPVWGQGSCVDFGNSGFFNCVSMAMDMHLVFEGLLRKLPENSQKKWVIGSIFEDQHEIAVLWRVDETTGEYRRAYILEAPMKILEGDGNEPGTAIATLEDLKFSMVSNAPILLEAKQGKFEEGPLLKFTTNQPNQKNIRFNGKLRGSFSNISAIARKEAKSDSPQTSSYEGMELADVDPGPIEMRKRVLSALYTKNPQFPLDEGMIMARDLIIPSVATVRALEGRDENEIDLLWGVKLGDMSLWSLEAVDALFRLRYRIRNERQTYSIGFSTNYKGEFPSSLIDRLEMGVSPQGADLVLEVQQPRSVKIPPGELKRFLGAVSKSKIDATELAYDEVREEDAIILATSQTNTFLKGKPAMNAKTVGILCNAKGESSIKITAALYSKLLNDFPALISMISRTANLYFNLGFELTFLEQKMNPNIYSKRKERLEFVLDLYLKVRLAGIKSSPVIQFNLALMLNFYNLNKLHPADSENLNTPEGQEFRNDVADYLQAKKASISLDEVIDEIKAYMSR